MKKIKIALVLIIIYSAFHFIFIPFESNSDFKESDIPNTITLKQLIESHNQDKNGVFFRKLNKVDATTTYYFMLKVGVIKDGKVNGDRLLEFDPSSNFHMIDNL